MSAKGLVFILVLLRFTKYSYCVLDYHCSMQNHCLNELVNYQCIVTDLTALTWRIIDINMTILATKSYSAAEDLGSLAPIQDAPDFSTELTSSSPIISNISFTVQSSINGYTIQCIGGNKINITTKNCTVNVAVPPHPNISFVFTATSIDFSWVPPSSQCIGSYEVESNATNSTLTTTDTSVSIPLAGLTTTTYYVSVASVDTANRTGEYSDRIIFELGVPQGPLIEYTSSSGQSDYATIELLLIFNQSGIPPLIAAHVLFDPSNVSVLLVDTQLLVDNTMSYNYSIYRIDIQRGIDYNVTGLGENILGNGSITTQLISVDKNDTFSHLPEPQTMSMFNARVSHSSTIASFSKSTAASTFASILPTASVETASIGSDHSTLIIAITVPLSVLVAVIILAGVVFLIVIRIHKNSKCSSQSYRYETSM